MAGEVVPLARKSCPCGWVPPDGMSVITLGIPPEVTVHSVVLRFCCPECGRILEKVSSPWEPRKEPAGT